MNINFKFWNEFLKPALFSGKNLFVNEIEVIDEIVEQIKNEKFDSIIGISRGGLVPAVKLSHILEIRDFKVVYASSYEKGGKKEFVFNLPIFESLEGKKVLIVDDLCDSGKTMKVILKELCKKNPKSLFKTAVMVKKEHSSFNPDFIGKKIKTDKWIVFSWEKKPDFKGEIYG